MPKTIDVINDRIRVFICVTGSGSIIDGCPAVSLDLMSEDEVDDACDELLSQIKKARTKAKKEVRKNKERGGHFPT